MEHQVPTPQRSPRSGGRGRRIARLDHPVDHPDDPTGPFSIRRDRRGTRPEQAISVWSRPDRRRAPGYGSGGVSTPRGRGRDGPAAEGCYPYLLYGVAQRLLDQPPLLRYAAPELTEAGDACTDLLSDVM